MNADATSAGSPAGSAETVTAKATPLRTEVANVNDPFAVIGSVSPPLSCSMRPVPSRPETVPVTAKVLVAHVTVTPVTSAATTVPLSPVTVHVCDGAPGWVNTVTA